MLPTYLAIGMTAGEFWHGEPRLAVAYREADKLRREMRYAAEWRAGYYVYNAIGASLSKEGEYPKEPLWSGVRDDEQVRERRERDAMERMKAAFSARAEKLNGDMAARAAQGGQ